VDGVFLDLHGAGVAEGCDDIDVNGISNFPTCGNRKFPTRVMVRPLRYG
jgi:hypothetical protein